MEEEEEEEDDDEQEEEDDLHSDGDVPSREQGGAAGAALPARSALHHQLTPAPATHTPTASASPLMAACLCRPRQEQWRRPHRRPPPLSQPASRRLVRRPVERCRQAQAEHAALLT